MKSNLQLGFSLRRATSKLSFTLLGVTAILLFGTGGVQAQTATTADPLQDLRRTSDADTGTFNSDNTTTSGLMNLFHRAVLGTPDYSGFNQRQQGAIGTEAERFRNQQRDRLRQAQPGQAQLQLPSNPGGIVPPRSTPQTGN